VPGLNESLGRVLDIEGVRAAALIDAGTGMLVGSAGPPGAVPGARPAGDPGAGYAALAAASQGLAQRMAAEAGKGALREATTRGSGGCVAVYPVGAVALLAVVGDEGLDTVRLYWESRATVEHLERLLTGGADRGKPQAAAS
jgi:hypothetical protein